MKKTYFGICLYIIFSFNGSLLYGQMNSINKKIIDLKQEYSTPTLSKAQMYQDFDSLYNIFKFCNPQIVVRKQITGIDILSELKALRNEIDIIKNPEDFIILLYRALRLSYDPHCQIGTSIWYYRNSIYKKEAKKYSNNFFACTFHYRDIINRNIIEFLHLQYIEGQYYLTNPLILYKTNDSINIPVRSIIKKINGQSINEYIQRNLDIQWDLRWDFIRKCYYVNSISSYSNYQLLSLEYIFNNKSCIVDSISKFRQQISSFDFTNYVEAKTVKYFSKDSILYIRCPLMNTSDIGFYKKEIAKFKGSPLEKVIVDIRGNWGGDDELWMTILKQIINIPIENKIVYLSSNSTLLSHYTKSKGFKPNKKTIVPNWDTTTIYKIVSEKPEIIKPSKSSLKFEGNIYIMQDDDIYSAAGSLSAMASYNYKIINVGRSNDKLGGRGIEPMSFGLPNSKMIFVMNILIDNTNVNTAKDIYHNDIKIPVFLPIDYYIDRNNYPENVYSETYLYNYDEFFKQVMKM